MASAVSALVLATLASVLAIGVRALPEPDDAADRSARRIAGLAMLHDDLGSAVSIVSASPSDFSVRVADRDNDGDQEIVRYWWSGVAGEGLTRTVNAVNETVVVPSLSAAAFSYDWLARTVPSGETALGTTEKLATWDGTTSSTHRIDLTSSLAQCLLLRLPADATAWQITKFRVRATSISSQSQLRAKLCLGGVDTLTVPLVLATSGSPILVRGSNGAWLDFNFSNAAEVQNGQWVSIHLGAQGLTGSAEVMYADKGVPDGRAALGLGSTLVLWTIASEGSVAFELYGRLRTPSGTASESRLSSFGAVLTPAEAGSAPIVVGVRTPGRPMEE